MQHMASPFMRPGTLLPSLDFSVVCKMGPVMTIVCHRMGMRINDGIVCKAFKEIDTYELEAQIPSEGGLFSVD